MNSGMCIFVGRLNYFSNRIANPSKIIEIIFTIILF